MKTILTALLIVFSISSLHAKPSLRQKASDVINNKNVVVIDITVKEAYKDGSIKINLNKALKGSFKVDIVKTVIWGCIGREASGYLKSGKRYVLIARGTDSLFCEAIWEVVKDEKGNLNVNYSNIFMDEPNAPFPKKQGSVSLKKITECVEKVTKS